MNFWLMKSEPGEFSLDDLERCGRTGAPWDGVRNFQARNMLRDDMRKGDLAFFYHSSCAEPGVVGIMEILGRGRPDPTALDPKSEHFDPDSRPEAPRWFLVDVRFKSRLPRPVALADMRTSRALRKLILLRRGNRLSVLPVTRGEWDAILALAEN